MSDAWNACTGRASPDKKPRVAGLWPAPVIDQLHVPGSELREARAEAAERRNDDGWGQTPFMAWVYETRWWEEFALRPPDGVIVKFFACRLIFSCVSYPTSEIQMLTAA